MSQSQKQRWKATIKRHLDDKRDPPRLPMNPPVDRLTDDDYCKLLFEDLGDAAPDGWVKTAAKPRTHEGLPKKPGLYMFVWNPSIYFAFENENVRTPFILYVGRAGGPNNTNTLKARYKSEYATVVNGNPESFWANLEIPDREARLRMYLALHPLEFWYLVVNDRHLIPDLEERLYNLYTPPINFAGGRRLRPGKVTAAF